MCVHRRRRFLCLSAVLHFFDVEPSEIIMRLNTKKNIIIIITVCVYIFFPFLSRVFLRIGLLGEEKNRQHDVVSAR